jgi:hypothetical protein
MGGSDHLIMGRTPIPIRTDEGGSGTKPIRYVTDGFSRKGCSRYLYHPLRMTDGGSPIRVRHPSTAIGQVAKKKNENFFLFLLRSLGKWFFYCWLLFAGLFVTSALVSVRVCETLVPVALLTDR